MLSTFVSHTSFALSLSTISQLQLLGCLVIRLWHRTQQCTATKTLDEMQVAWSKKCGKCIGSGPREQCSFNEFSNSACTCGATFMGLW